MVGTRGRKREQREKMDKDSYRGRGDKIYRKGGGEARGL